jgi:hypothetical protein
MGFVFNDFGILESVRMDDQYVFILNTKGEMRMMSKVKYKDSADKVFLKAQDLIGKNVKIQTSQNTSNWSESKWFSDLFEK